MTYVTYTWRPEFAPVATSPLTTLLEGAPMTDTITAATVTELRAVSSVTTETITPWRDTIQRWIDTVGPDNAAVHSGADGVCAAPQSYWYSIPLFARWCDEQGITEPPVPQGNVAPIGPGTPGWSQWWSDLWERASEDNGDDYIEQYNALARALGGPVREEEEEDEESYVVEVDVTLRVTVRTSARPSDVDNNGMGEYVDEEQVDEAIRDYIRSQSVEWEIYDYSQD